MESTDAAAHTDSNRGHEVNPIARAVLRTRNLLKRVRYSAARKTAGGGHTESALYCYGIWLRHLVVCCDHAGSPIPTAVAEIGPGRSLGTCLAAMLCGADRVWAFDHIRYVDPQESLQILDELVRLFQSRANIPDETVLPRAFPELASYEFPKHILTDQHLAAALAPERLASIRSALQGTSDGKITIQYIAPWDPRVAVPGCAVDHVFSQAVMLYVNDLEEAYAAMRRWLSPGGITSHTINFSAVNIVPSWDGHWNYDDDAWSEIEGTQPYRISRNPYSAHVSAMRSAGLEIAHVSAETKAPSGERHQLAPRFRTLSDEDRKTVRAFIVARCL